jgi:hypothetical protein
MAAKPKKPKKTGQTIPGNPSDKILAIIEDVKKRRPPLAAVIEAMGFSNTWRDNPREIARDIALMLAARNPNSPIKAALDYYESTEIVNQQKDRIMKDLTGES